ncbi:MAG: LD-carboxypeptidase [Proteobacteria bacterium]|nr:LD-carboxypeptidase [Pseudomonadota bacterium]
MSNINFTKIRPLRHNGTIGVFCSSGPLAKDRVDLGINNIEKLGYKVKLPLDPSEFYGRYDHSFFAGSIQQRVDSVHTLLDDPDVDVLIAARGAYGTQEILPLLDYKKIKKSQKAIVGMSDITTLLVAANSLSEIVTIHGATFGSSFADYQNDSEAKTSVDSLLKLLTDKSDRFNCPLRSLRKGECKGRIISGNLTLLTAMLGTDTDLNYNGAILVLEDVGEKPFQVQRNLLHLKSANKLDSLAGLVFGRFVKCEAANGPSVEEAIEYFIKIHLADTSYPIYKDIPVGHFGLNMPLPLGCLAEIRNDNFTMLESPLM